MPFTYFLLDNGAGKPYEVYRSTLRGSQFHEGQLERAKRNGSWSAEDMDVRLLLNLWLKGDFDPESDEITEEKAHAYLRSWRASGWPGRP